MKISFVGLGGCPFSNRAADVRQNAFAELFVELGYEVEIINRFSRTKNNRRYSNYKVVEPFRNVKAKGKASFVFFYTLTLLLEPLRLLHSHFTQPISIIYVYSAHTIDHILYKLLAWVIGAKMVSQYCEFHSCSLRNNFYFRFNKKYIDSFVPKLWDGAFCISHFLMEECHKTNPKTKTLLVYPICNFSNYNEMTTSIHSNEDYLLLCSSVSYQSVVRFCIKSYLQSKASEVMRLVVVLSGDRQKIDKLKKEFPEVTFLYDIDYTLLIDYYRNAKALLIPLRENVRDKARFPHKICEYVAAKGLVVTTNLGEMPYVFKDGENALVANGYDINTFSEKLDMLANNHDFMPIRNNCYQMGLELFDIHAYLNPMKAFLESVTKMSNN